MKTEKYTVKTNIQVVLSAESETEAVVRLVFLIQKLNGFLKKDEVIDVDSIRNIKVKKLKLTWDKKMGGQK